MSDDIAGGTPPGASERAPGGLDVLTDEVVPALITRLRASRLGELEVRTQTWRVRLRRDSSKPLARMSAPGTTAAEPDDGLSGSVATSPAVGYFTPAPELAIGRAVQAGDLLGSVDVLGIAQEVNAPTGGIVSRVLVEQGQAVEYGQALADIDALELDLESTPPEAGDR